MIASLGQAVPHVCTLGDRRPRPLHINCRLASKSQPSKARNGTGQPLRDSKPRTSTPTIGHWRPRTRKVDCRPAGESCPHDICGQSAGAYQMFMMVHCEPGQTGYASAPCAGPDPAGSIMSKLLCLHPHSRTRSRAIDTSSPRRACRQDRVQVWPHHAPSHFAL
jgi:hypothetical protein